MRLAVLSLVAFAVLPSVTRGQAPVFEITPLRSWIKFDVKASINIAGKFDKWDATLTFTSPDETTGVLEIIIQAASVDTGSGMKNGKLKSKDFFIPLPRSEEHTSELQSLRHLVCRLLLEKKKKKEIIKYI